MPFQHEQMNFDAFGAENVTDVNGNGSPLCCFALAMTFTINAQTIYPSANPDKKQVCSRV